MFFSFQLALPKTSVLLLCQRNSDFLTFFILFFAPLPFFPLLLGHFALCPLEVYSFFYSLLIHSLSFRGSLRSFSMSVCFNSRFLTFLYCFFPLLLKHFALCPFQFYKQPFALYFPLLLFSFFFVCGIHLLRYF